MECRVVTVREGSEADLAPVTEIYNHYVERSPATLDSVPYTTEGRKTWMGQFAKDGPYRLFVADIDGLVVGYSTSTRLDDKLACVTSVKTEVFIAPAYCGRGLGRRLYDRLFETLREEDLHRAYAAVTLPNEASMNLHQNLGFEKTGLFKEVARKFGRYWDVLWLSRQMP
jgi:phosphinothricin acetyltransferase